MNTRLPCPKSNDPKNIDHVILYGSDEFPFVYCHKTGDKNCTYQEAMESGGFDLPDWHGSTKDALEFKAKVSAAAPLMTRPADPTFTYRDLYAEPKWFTVKASKLPHKDGATSVTPNRWTSRDGLETGKDHIPAYAFTKKDGTLAVPVYCLDFDFKYDVDPNGDPLTDDDCRAYDAFLNLYERIGLLTRNDAGELSLDPACPFNFTDSSSNNGVAGHIVLQFPDADKERVAKLSTAKGLRYDAPEFGKRSDGKARFGIDLFFPSDNGRYVVLHPNYERLNEAQQAILSPL